MIWRTSTIKIITPFIEGLYSRTLGWITVHSTLNRNYLLCILACQLIQSLFFYLPNKDSKHLPTNLRTVKIKLLIEFVTFLIFVIKHRPEATYIVAYSIRMDTIHHAGAHMVTELWSVWTHYILMSGSTVDGNGARLSNFNAQLLWWNSFFPSMLNTCDSITPEIPKLLNV